MRLELKGAGALAAVAAFAGLFIYNDLRRAPDMRRDIALEAAGHLQLAQRYTAQFDCGEPRASSSLTAADAARSLISGPFHASNAPFFFAHGDEDAIAFALHVRPSCKVVRIVRHDRDLVNALIREATGAESRRRRYRRTTIYPR
ncbi:MAG: hypothetical protein AAGJ87_05205 [Pseudomonadota bacterium]